METTSKNKYRLVFSSRTTSSPKSHRVIRETSVQIFEENEELPIAMAAVRQHVCDQDCKFTGQKRAVEKALRNFASGDLFKDIRSSIWQEFFKRSKHGQKLIGIAA